MTENPSSITQHGKCQELKRLGFRLEILFSPDATSCTAAYEPVAGGPPLLNSDLQAFLAQAGVRTGVRQDAVEHLLCSANGWKAVHDLLLAEGTPMVPGEDARIVLKRSESAEPAPAPAPDAEDSSESVDFHRVQEFLNVQEGETIAAISPATEGTQGLSVLGHAIPPKAGAPAAAKLGKNVRFDDDGVTIIATAAGRVFCQGMEISVEDIYQVRGDVNFKVGSIDFNGFLEVTGDILDGFDVRASKGIKVIGNVGACTVVSDGDITFCGMNGQGKGVVHCGGSLRANFIYEAKVEVAGDLIVNSEMRLCGVKCLGAVHVTKGMVGGECVALAGMETGSLGSVTSLHTRVVVGVSYRDLEELSQRFNELKELGQRQNLAMGSRGQGESLLQERAAITALIQSIRKRRYDQANPKINVRKMMFGGVTVSLGTLTEEFREEREGPFSIIENRVEGGVRFLGMTDLALNASFIEDAFVRQAQLQG